MTTVELLSVQDLQKGLKALEKAVAAGKEQEAEDALKMLSVRKVSTDALVKTEAGRRVKALKRATGSTAALRTACVKCLDSWRSSVRAEATAAPSAAGNGGKKGKSTKAAAPTDDMSRKKLAALEELYQQRTTVTFREAMQKVIVSSPLVRSEKAFKVGDTIMVADRMQTGYSYTLDAPMGRDFDPGFNPSYTPAEMLELGVFEGKYLNDGLFEFPKEWYERALAAKKICRTGNKTVNRTKADSRQPLGVWKQNGWLHAQDPRGWFQWYCRYYMGRRTPKEDARQIGRWRSFGPRHTGQIKANCQPGDCMCRPRQRQGLLQWSYPFDI